MSEFELFAVLEQLPYATGLWDTELRYLYFNKAGEIMSGIAIKDAAGKTPFDFLPTALCDKFVPLICKARDEKCIVNEVINLDFGQGDIYLKVTYSPIYDDQGKVTKIIGITEDITIQIAQSKKLEEYSKQLKYDAEHDFLTKLPNRNAFTKHVKESLKSVSPTQKKALFFLDLNHFKELNDTLGHSTGDEILIGVGERLKSLSNNKNVFIARTGGDEFALYLSQFKDEEELSSFAKSVIALIRKPFKLDAFSPSIGGSLGIAIAPDHADDINTLMKYADIAMYRAKAEFHDIQLYNNSLNKYSHKRLELISSLGHAIKTNQLELYYQPIIDVKNDSVNSFEALLRWNHPKFGMVGPSEFIPLIENSNLIHDVSQWVLYTALTQVEHWRDEGYNHKVSINLSAANLVDDQFMKSLQVHLDKIDVDEDCLTLEITEHSMMNNPEKAIELLKKMYDFGTKLMIDDYGTGYSSLSHLKKIPVDALKIDMSFIQELLSDEQNATIVSSTILMAHNLGIKVVAEGIEDEPTYMKLKELGCDYAQGYYLAKPMPSKEASKWFEARK